MKNSNCFALFFSRKLTALIFSLIILASLIGCSTAVNTIVHEDNATLEDGEGYVVIGFDSDYSVKRLLLSGKRNIHFSSESLHAGSNFIVSSVSAGVYTIEKILLNDYFYLEMDGDNWDVEVESGKLNYVGHLRLRKSADRSNFYFFRLENRSTEALEFLTREFGSVVRDSSIVYGGPGEDRFFDYISELR